MVSNTCKEVLYFLELGDVFLSGTDYVLELDHT